MAASSARQGKPPPLPARAQNQRARLRARPRRPPPPTPVEYLAEEFVHEDIDAYEVLPDEFVLEDESPVIFAGPSDAPPRPEPQTPNAITHALWTGPQGDARRSPSMQTLLLYAAVCIAGVAAIARFTGSPSPQAPAGKAHSAAASPMPSSPPATEDLPPSLLSAPPPESLAWEFESVGPKAPASVPRLGASAPASVPLAVASAPTSVPLVVARAPAVAGAPGNVPPTAASALAAPEAPSEALEKKQGSQEALEKGKVALSIELGERAVELDPTDADSWLILGAAYMQRGDMKNARRCFSSCVNQATTGQEKECVAMLR
jgi:ChAPs (Chs5p-Arf1p-binding proteins)